MTIGQAARVLSAIPEPFRLLRVREAAVVTGMHRRTIYRRIRNGEVRAWGNPRRVVIDDLLRPFVPDKPEEAQ